MTEIEIILNDTMALPNINNGNPLRHNEDLCRHPIIILLEVVNDAAPCKVEVENEQARFQPSHTKLRLSGCN